jgi:hypothetical protein
VNKLRRRKQRHRRQIELDHICPPCRVCGKTDAVACYDPRQPKLTVCMECCGNVKLHPDGESGHKYEWDGHEHRCIYCSAEADAEWHADRAAHMAQFEAERGWER